MSVIVPQCLHLLKLLVGKYNQTIYQHLLYIYIYHRIFFLNISKGVWKLCNGSTKGRCQPEHTHTPKPIEKECATYLLWSWTRGNGQVTYFSHEKYRKCLRQMRAISRHFLHRLWLVEKKWSRRYGTATGGVYKFRIFYELESYRDYY